MQNNKGINSNVIIFIISLADTKEHTVVSQLSKAKCRPFQKQSFNSYSIPSQCWVSTLTASPTLLSLPIGTCYIVEYECHIHGAFIIQAEHLVSTRYFISHKFLPSNLLALSVCELHL